MTRLAFVASFCVVFSSVALATPRPVAPAPLLPTSFSLLTPTVAANSSRFLTAWRVDTFAGTRADGMVIDESGHRTASAARPLVRGVSNTKMLRAGDEFVLSYEDDRRIRRFARFDGQGQFIATSGLSFTNSPIVIGSDDGRRILVLRYEPAAITAVLLDESLSIVRSDIYVSSGTSELLAVAADGAGFAILNRDVSGLRLQRLAATGTVSDPVLIQGTTATGGYFNAGVASNGDRTLVFWTSRSADSKPETSGVVIEQGAVVKRVSIPATDVQSVVPRRLVWIGDMFVLLLNTSSTGTDALIQAVRFAPDGSPLDARAVTVAGSAGAYVTFADAAWNGQLLYVTATERTLLGDRVLGVSVILKPGVLMDTFTDVLSILPARQTSPAASGALVVWREQSVDGQRLRAALAGGGAPPVTFMTAEGFIGEPAIAFGGGIYLVGFEFFGHLLAVRFNERGEQLDPIPLTIAVRSGGGFGKPAIAWNGSQFLVAWNGSPIQGAFVTLNGTIGAQHPLTMDGEGGSDPVLAWNGTRFALAYAVSYIVIGFPPFDARREVHVAAVDSSGTPVAGAIAVVEDDAHSPRIATSGAEFLLVTQQPNRVTGVWLDSSVRLVNSAFLADPSQTAVLDAVAWIGDRYAIATHARSIDAAQLRVGFVAPLATTVSERRAIASLPDWQGGGSTALGGNGREAFVVFSDVRHDDESGGSSRLLLERLEDLEPAVTKRRAVRR